MEPMIIIGLIVAVALLVLAIMFARHKATTRKRQGRTADDGLVASAAPLINASHDASEPSDGGGDAGGDGGGGGDGGS